MQKRSKKLKMTQSTENEALQTLDQNKRREEQKNKDQKLRSAIEVHLHVPFCRSGEGFTVSSRFGKKHSKA